jgi:hypothetical protein
LRAPESANSPLILALNPLTHREYENRLCGALAIVALPPNWHCIYVFFMHNLVQLSGESRRD